MVEHLGPRLVAAMLPKSCSAKRIKKLAERLDFLGRHGLREQPLDLPGDAEIGGGPRIEVAQRLVIALGVDRGCERVADRTERAPPCVVQYTNSYGHLHISSLRLRTHPILSNPGSARAPARACGTAHLAP